MKRLVLAAALLMVPALSLAATADFSWSLPTTYTDNSAISASDQALMTTTLYQATSATGPWTAVYTSAAGATSATGVTLATMSRGSTYYFSATVTLGTYTSDYADPVSYVYGRLAPSKPRNINIRNVK